MIDMEITSIPPTRAASPMQRVPNGAATPSAVAEETVKKDDGDLVARKAGMGRLMKSAKQDIQVPEFDMNAFF